VVQECTNTFHSLCSNMGIKDLMCNFWTSLHLEPLIDMLSILKKSFNRRVRESLGLRIGHIKRMVNASLTNITKDKSRKTNLKTTSPGLMQRRVR
jgi:hypothetical protein